MTRVFVLLNSSQEMRYPVGTRQKVVQQTARSSGEIAKGGGSDTCEDAVLLRRVFPADFERRVQDFCEAQVTYRSWS